MCVYFVDCGDVVVDYYCQWVEFVFELVYVVVIQWWDFVIFFWVQVLQLGFVGVYYQYGDVGGEYCFGELLQVGIVVLVVDVDVVFYCYWNGEVGCGYCFVYCLYVLVDQCWFQYQVGVEVV